MVSIFLWVSICSSTLFLILKKLGIFRVPKEIEIIGVDIAELGGVDEEVYSRLRAMDFE